MSNEENLSGGARGERRDARATKLGWSLTNAEGQRDVFLGGDFTQELDLIVGTIDGEGRFSPELRRNTKDLENSLQELERQFVWKNEGLASGLDDLIFKEAEVCPRH